MTTITETIPEVDPDGIPPLPGVRGRRAAPRPPKPPRAPKVPKPPRRMPVGMVPLPPMSDRRLLARSISLLLAAALLGFVLNLLVFSHLQHVVDQQQLRATFREQLAEGTAPVSEGTFDNVLLADGAPVAVIDIPSINVHEVIAEGTSSPVLMGGPGHRRDSVLPGQQGLSVVMGRASAYGGPFSRIQELQPGDKITVTTGQGKLTFSVIGLRYAGDPSPPALTAGQSRLTLETARGAWYVPTGVARVDALLTSKSRDDGARQTTAASLPPEDKEMAGDSTTVWALVFGLQLLIAVELVAVWSLRRVGGRRTWVVFVPLTALAVLFVASQVTNLLPNLL